MKLPQLALRDLFWLIALVAMGCGWWLDRRYLAAELAALRRANELARLEGQVRESVGVPIKEVGSSQTPQEFIQSLHDIKDWYEFADRTADPFARSPVAEEAIPALMELLSHDSEETRTRAACALGKIKRQPEVVVPALVPLLGDDKPNVRWHAAFALQSFGPQAAQAAPALWEQVASEDSPIAAFSANVLQTIQPEMDIQPALIKLLKNHLVENRRRAVAALAGAKSEQLKKALVEAFDQESDQELRDQMAKAIAAQD